MKATKLTLKSYMKEDNQFRIHIVSDNGISLGWIDKRIFYEKPTHVKYCVGRIINRSGW